MAINSGLAVLDLVAGLIFASPGKQPMFEGSNWATSAARQADEDWLRVGCFIRHSTFGDGRVFDIGTYKGLRVLVIQFSDAERLISLEHGLPHIRPIPRINGDAVSLCTA